MRLWAHLSALLDTLEPMYHERLRPTITWFIASLLIVPAAILALAPINFTLGVVVSVLLYAAIVALLLAKSPTIEVSDSHFRAGRGRIERSFLGEAEAIAPQDNFDALHSQLDARAWLCVRGWAQGLVRVPLNDANDPTPYWLVSTRHPEQLAAALNAAQ